MAKASSTNRSAANRPFTVQAKFISATEVNRFCYCPWQWYYERVYGAATLRQLVKERNEALGLAPADYTQGAFARGRAFHEQYASHYAARRRRRLAAGLIGLTAVVACLCWLWMWLHYA